jgi:iron complex outermembrane receptor protein
MRVHPVVLLAPLWATWAAPTAAQEADGAGADSAIPPGSNGSPPAPASPDSVTSPPRLVAGTAPRLPPGLVGEAFVDLIVVIGADGRLEEATVEASSSPELEPEALAIVRTWAFEPAQQDAVAVRAKVRLRVEFEPATIEGPKPSARAAAAASTPEPVAPSPPAPSPARHDHSGPHGQDAHLEITVHGTRAPRAEIRGPSDYFVHSEVLSAAPHLEGADVLRAVPGLLTTRTEGLAVAHSLNLRGFDAEHGQDVAISVGGLPINLPSHIHGQGYADVGFLVAEAVDHLLVKEGVADPRQGDFAVAGSIDVGLGVDDDRRGLFVESGFGSFDTFRQKVIWAPKEAQRESLGAVQLTTTGGFGDNRGGKAGSAILQHRFGTGDVTYRAIAIGHAADAESAGVVRKDDVDDDVVCFTCVYDDPSARAQGASAARLMGGLFADYVGPEHASGTLGFWTGIDDFRSLSNLTGYVQVSHQLPGVSGRGDLFEQTNRTNSLGLVGRYRTQAIELSSSVHGTLEAGVDGRLDLVSQSQSLIDASVHNQVWDERVRADLRLMQLGTFLDLDAQFGRALTLRGGVRVASQSYETYDHLGNLPDPNRPGADFLPGYRSTATGVAVLPRTSLELRATGWLSFLSSYGQGYRSAQAALLEEGESAPLAITQSADLGVRAHFGKRLDAKLTGHATFLSDEVTLDPTTQGLESVGPSARVGATLHVQTTPWDWLVGALSVTWVRATLEGPPAATPEEPFPPYVPGQAVPGVPALTLRLDWSAERTLGIVAGQPLDLHFGSGLTVASERPLGYAETTAEVAWLDVAVGLEYRRLELTFSGYNLAGGSMAAAEAVFVSNWTPQGVPSRVPERHVFAAAPPSFMLTLGVTL